MVKAERQNLVPDFGVSRSGERVCFRVGAGIAAPVDEVFGGAGAFSKNPSVTHMHTGRKTLTSEGSDSLRLFGEPQFKAIAGRSFDLARDFVAVMLSNRADPSTTSSIACDYVPGVKCLTVKMNKHSNKGTLIDISYLIVLRW